MPGPLFDLMVTGSFVGVGMLLAKASQTPPAPYRSPVEEWIVEIRADTARLRAEAAQLRAETAQIREQLHQPGTVDLSLPS